MEQPQTQQTKKPNPNKVTPKNIEFKGRVIEAVSGDTLVIQSIKSEKLIERFVLTNLRAPVMFKNTSKPYAWEAKEFLRKNAVGKEVTVKMEYEKTFKVTREKYDEEEDDYVEVTEEKRSIFALVELEGKQLAKEVVSKGFATVQCYHEEEQSAIFEELQLLEEEAKKKKLNVHSNKEYKLKTLRDLSNKEHKNSKQIKASFEHLKDQKLTGVVELVLNGSRFKLRVNEQNCYLMMVVSGVRCLPNDKNFAGYEIWSNKALQFSKQHILQRDVEFVIQKVDKTGVFQGTILLNKKSDYAETLLREGLAVTFGSHTKSKAYEGVEQTARDSKTGLWGSPNLDLKGVQGEFGVRQTQDLNETRNVLISECVDINEFYIQNPINQNLQKLEGDLAKYDSSKSSKLSIPVKAQTPCLALFSADNNYYRAHVVREVQNKKNKYLVHFYDYGNYEEVHHNDLRQMPSSYQKLPPQAEKCALAYIVGANKKQDAYGESIDVFMDEAWEKKLTAQFVYKYADTKYCLLYPQGQSDPQKSLNRIMLAEGVAKIDKQSGLPEEFDNWEEVQEAAREKRYGIWKNVQE